jgi:hypothetical protein
MLMFTALHLYDCASPAARRIIKTAAVAGAGAALLLASCATPCQAAHPVYTAPKPKGPVFQTTTSEAVATPTESGVLSRPNSWGLVRLHRPRMVSGWDGPTRKDGRTASDVCLNIPAHPERFKPQQVALVPPEGAKTMTATHQGRTAPASLYQRQHQALADAINSASMARLHTLRGNLPAAQRRTRQHLAALNQLAKLEG